MADARGKDNWNHTSSVLAMLFNINRDPKRQRAISPQIFNPYITHKTKKDTRMAFDFMKEMWVCMTDSDKTASNSAQSTAEAEKEEK